MKGFARSVPQMLASTRAAGHGEQLLAEVPDHRLSSTHDCLFDREEVRGLLARLSDRERSVVHAHYGLEGHDSPATHDQVAERLGLSRREVRQIEQSALGKLRLAMGVALA